MKKMITLPTKETKNSKDKFVFLMLMLLMFMVGTSQTVHINPSTNGGFESGATFAANGWTATTGTSTENQWVCSTGATSGFSGTRCAYITNNTGSTPPPHSYTLNANRRTHFYRDVTTIPNGETDIRLSFNWIGRGQNGQDRIRIWLTPTTYAPAYGTAVTATGSTPTGRFLLTQLQNQSSWTSASFIIPSNYAGQNFRLIFEWINNDSSGNQPPGAIDNISLTSQAGPSNNECINATALTVNPSTTCSVTTSGTTIGATLSQSGCTGTADDDVWYSFVATSSNHEITVTAGTINDIVLQVFSGNCGSLNNIICRDATAESSSEIAIASGLIIGQTYYVRVYSFANNSGMGTFTICATTLPNSVNDHCSIAIPLSVNNDTNCTLTTSGTTEFGGPSFAGCSGSADDDVWYSFVATSQSHLVTVTPGTLNNAVLQVFSGNCGVLTSLLCINSSNGSSPEEASLGGLTIGQTYYIRVYSFNNGSGNGTFTLCITTPLVVNTSTTSYTVDQLVREVLFENSCVSITNINSSTGTNFGDANGIGYFDRNGATFPFDNGIVLSTGNANFASGPISYSTNSVGGNSWLGDPDVQVVMSAVSGSPQTARNASFIQFDFVPFQNTISFDFLFASNEYGFYQCDFSDTFIFLLTNLNTGVTTNIAVVPSTSTPISVVSIRDQIYNSDCSSVNQSYFGNYYLNDPTNAPINFYGTTVPLTAIGNVVPGQAYRIKLAIADRLDTLLDSAVFINGSSFSIGDIALGDDLFIDNNTALCYGESVLLDPGLDATIFDFQWYQDSVAIPGATGSTYNVTEWGDYRVRASIKGNPGCFTEDEVRIEIFPEIAPRNPRNIIKCNFGEPFDLTENNARLLSLYPAPTYGVSYFTSLSDAQNNINPIVNPQSFTETSNPQMIYARVFNIERGCYGLRSFHVRRPKTWNGSVNTDWNTPNNWTPVGVPTDEDCIIVHATANNPIISGTNYVGYGYNIDVRDNATLTIQAGNHLKIVDQVVVRPTGTMDFQNNASLVQVNEVTNIGNIRYNRSTSIRRNDYVYWSSPVQNFHLNNLSPGTPTSVRFMWNPTIANSNGGFGNWVNANETMVASKGYIVRGPSSFNNTTAQTFTATFTGVPNNGTITIPVSRGNYTGADYPGTNGVMITNMDDNFNLIGNPYPSAIRFTDFMAANPDLEGSIRVWTHGTLPSNANGNPFYGSFVYNYSSNDYIIHNGTGTISGPATYDGFIPAGQSFFVAMLDGPATTVDVTFNNGMRVESNNTQFFKNSSTSTPKLVNDKNRIWLDLVASNGNVSRTLVGYIFGATNGKDRMFDAYTKVDNALVLYSIIENEKACIQGRKWPFDVNDAIPLGYKVSSVGNYTLAIASVDGFFRNNGQIIYLKDNFTNQIHNLNEAPYTFSSNIGTFDNRFEIVFNSQDSSFASMSENSQKVNVKTNDKVEVESKNDEIKTLLVYDIYGRTIKKYENVNSRSIDLKGIEKINRTLLLKIELKDGTITTKKVIF